MNGKKAKQLRRSCRRNETVTKELKRMYNSLNHVEKEILNYLTDGGVKPVSFMKEEDMVESVSFPAKFIDTGEKPEENQQVIRDCSVSVYER